MEQLLLIVYVLISAAIVGLILLQQGKGADMGASFGSGASQTLFGSAGSGNVLTRATAILATLFFVASIGLAVMAKQKAEAARDASIPVPALDQKREAQAKLDELLQKSGVGEQSTGAHEVPAVDGVAEKDGGPAADSPDPGTNDVPEV